MTTTILPRNTTKIKPKEKNANKCSKVKTNNSTTTTPPVRTNNNHGKWHYYYHYNSRAFYSNNQ